MIARSALSICSCACFRCCRVRWAGAFVLDTDTDAGLETGRQMDQLALLAWLAWQWLW